MKCTGGVYRLVQLSSHNQLKILSNLSWLGREDSILRMAECAEYSITATPSSGAAGLAIKSYLALRYESGRAGVRQPLARKPSIIRPIPEFSRMRSALCLSWRR
jgi:hypothetical protein